MLRLAVLGEPAQTSKALGRVQRVSNNEDMKRKRVTPDNNLANPLPRRSAV